MDNQSNLSEQTLHPGGDTNFWRDEMVRRYEYQQALLSEKKGEVLLNIVRIVNYFCKLRAISNPSILDIGCGPGTQETLSARVLEKVTGSTVVGVDSSSQMIEVTNNNLIHKYGQRFLGTVSDFNNDKFWVPEIDYEYDFIVSNGALHYLSDRRRSPFLREISDHIRDNGAFVCCLGNLSETTDIAEMERVFRVEFTYNQLDEDKRPQDFQIFKQRFEETDKKANINWRSYDTWLDAMRNAGFKEVDIVWHLWIRSIFVAIK